MTDTINRELLYAAAGQTGLLKYACPGCKYEIFAKLPVDLSCNLCEQDLVGTDIM